MLRDKMKNFDIMNKNHIIFGLEEENNVGKHIKKYSNTCLIVHDGGPYLKNLLNRIKKSLEEEHVLFWELSGIMANPLVSKANEGIEILKKNNIEFILAVGGGSVMDTAKYISYAAYCSDENPLDLRSNANLDSRIIPKGAVVTLSGTSSECSNCAMIVNDMSGELVKYAIGHPCLYFDFSIVNPELAYTLPQKQLASGIMDGISHALEAYFALKEEAPLFEGYFETAIKTLLEYGPRALESPQNYTYRSIIAVAVMMAYNNNFVIGGIDQDWGCHNIERPITTTFGSTHGLILGIITPAFMRYTYKFNPTPFVSFAIKCMSVEQKDKSDYEIVDEGATRLEEWLDGMGLPTKFSSIGINLEELIPLAEKVAPAGAVYKLNRNDIIEIYKLCV